jgi:hypothetical protein
MGSEIEKQIDSNSDSDVLSYSGPFKIVVIGDMNASKDAVINNMLGATDRELISECEGTKSFKVHSDELAAKFNIWYRDDASTDQYPCFKDAQGVLVVFDLLDRGSFENMVEHVKQMINLGGKMLPLIIIGNNFGGEITEDYIMREEVLEYAYSLGNVSNCKVPYLEHKFGVRKLNLDPLKFLKDIIICEKMEGCFNKPTQLRQSCDLKQFYIYE